MTPRRSACLHWRRAGSGRAQEGSIEHHTAPLLCPAVRGCSARGAFASAIGIGARSRISHAAFTRAAPLQPGAVEQWMQGRGVIPTAQTTDLFARAFDPLFLKFHRRKRSSDRAVGIICIAIGLLRLRHLQLCGPEAQRCVVPIPPSSAISGSMYHSRGTSKQRAAV